MSMPGRTFSAGSGYRYGFNGKENDNEVKGEGNQQDYGMRIYDVRLGRFISTDPITEDYPELTPYQFASNRPVDGIDQDGLEYLSSFRSSQIKYFETKTTLTLAKPKPREPQILMADIYGNGHIGPQSVVKANVTLIRQKYYNAVADNIAGGPFGAAGYLIGGDKGSFAGAAVDGMALSLGGIGEKSSVFPIPRRAVQPSMLRTSTEIAPAEQSPINPVINQKPTWNKEQVAEAYEKAQTITNNPESKVTIKNPAIRPSNLRRQYLKRGGKVSSTQDLDHNTDLQINGTNDLNNLSGRDKSVNRSFGRQLQIQIQNVPENTRVNKVSINPFTGKKL
jgi:RHS repeat-associated protein